MPYRLLKPPDKRDGLVVNQSWGSLVELLLFKKGGDSPPNELTGHGNRTLHVVVSNMILSSSSRRSAFVSGPPHCPDRHARTEHCLMRAPPNNENDDAEGQTFRAILARQQCNYKRKAQTHTSGRAYTRTGAASQRIHKNGCFTETPPNAAAIPIPTDRSHPAKRPPPPVRARPAAPEDRRPTPPPRGRGPPAPHASRRRGAPRCAPPTRGNGARGPRGRNARREGWRRRKQRR